MRKLYIDIETYSSVDLRTSGRYKYMESLDFEILLVAYAFDDEPIKCIDLASGEELSNEFLEALFDLEVEKHAHNAAFERNAFKTIGFDIPTGHWRCSMFKAAYCGLPLSLELISKSLNLGEKGKLSTGKALIRYFCIPCKPTKTNGGRERNLPHHHSFKWGEFIKYCVNDVEAEREVDRFLGAYKIPQIEREIYKLDQEINDIGIEIDLNFAQNAFDIDTRRGEFLMSRMKEITRLDNPNSLKQLKEWLKLKTKEDIGSLAKDQIPILIEKFDSPEVEEVLKLRQRMSKTSTKKYTAMLNCACDDNRAHGLFQFYGANRTGRWAGRLIQLQNLPQNHISNLQLARDVIAEGDYETVEMLYDNISNLLSQLIRTAFVAKEGHTFAVADFSAIEARVIAWLAGETWRLDVFKSHGKIYEASAAMMFGIPIEEITKGSDLRQKGKIAELALGYQGSVGALTTMGGESMGLCETQMRDIVGKWRQSNPNIVKYWKRVENAAKKAIKNINEEIKLDNISFLYDELYLRIKLPSGRSLFYYKPKFTINKFGQPSIQYRGMNQTTKQWDFVDTYGGKLVENIVQAVARDLLAYSMLKLKESKFNIVMHVHDENVCEVPIESADRDLAGMVKIMSQGPDWSKGLPLGADGYTTPFYKKD